jgi:hypothetical protein
MLKAIHKKVVMDETNKPVEVIINYDEWKEIEQLLDKELKVATKEQLKSYAGTLHLEEDPLVYQRRMRSEWQ